MSGTPSCSRTRPKATNRATPRAVTCQASQIHSDSLVDGLGLPVRLWVERRAHQELDSGAAEQITPDVTCEHGVTVADYGLRDAVKPHDVLEEGSGHGRSCIGVAKRNEMCILRETVDHREQDTLAMDLGQRLNEVEGDVSPDARGDRQWLQKTGRVQRLHLVALTRGAGSDELAHHTAIVFDEELSSEAMERLLDAFMASCVG